jgi:predicted TIM-barrel fold metal-dependent hydrolase
LRPLIDTVSVDPVLFGTDWAWLLEVKSLTDAEKEAILSRNLEQLLGA